MRDYTPRRSASGRVKSEPIDNIAAGEMTSHHSSASGGLRCKPMKQPAKRTRAIAELRKHNRYRLEAPVIFSWKDAQGIRQQGVGLTHAMSVRGAFIFATEPPPLNAKIELSIYLPPRSAVRPPRIYGQGRVVRVEPAHRRHRAGFAVAAEPFVLRRSPACQYLEMTCRLPWGAPSQIAPLMNHQWRPASNRHAGQLLVTNRVRS